MSKKADGHLVLKQNDPGDSDPLPTGSEEQTPMPHHFFRQVKAERAAAKAGETNSSPTQRK